MQTPLAAFRAVKLRYQYAVRALEDSFHATKVSYVVTLQLVSRHSIIRGAFLIPC